MIGPRRRWQVGVAGVSALLTVGAVAPGVSAKLAPPPGVVGQWTPPFAEGGAAEAPTAAEAAVLGDGRVFYFNGIESRENPLAPSSPSHVRLLDLGSGTPHWDPPAQGRADLSCSDLTALPDGRLLLVGGTADLFDPRTDTFHHAAPMKYGRWYPHVAIGPDGNPTAFGGVTRLTSDTQLGQVRRTETYDAATDRWTENFVGPASENALPLQPRIVLAPNGKFFYAAVGETAGPSGHSPDEATRALYQFFDPEKKRWSVSGAAPLGARSGAFVAPLMMAPPYDEMTLLTGGGVLGLAPGSGLAANPLTTLTTIDVNGKVASRMTGNLNHARWFSSGVLLPDGQLLAVGGDDKDDAFAPGPGGAVKTPELYNPVTGQWTDVAPHARARGYHNSALLLADMRVLLGGNDDPSFEVWSPPYLFRGPRPTVTRVQRGVGYGEAFTITTPDADLIESVLLLRTPSPGHVNDSDQRALRLDFTRGAGDVLTATAPPSGTVAPPGAYYLVVNRKSLQGPIPSVAHMVDVGGTDGADALQPFRR